MKMCYMIIVIIKCIQNICGMQLLQFKMHSKLLNKCVP